MIQIIKYCYKLIIRSKVVLLQFHFCLKFLLIIAAYSFRPHDFIHCSTSRDHYNKNGSLVSSASTHLHVFGFHSPETWWRAKTRAETVARSQRCPRRCPWCRSEGERTEHQPISAILLAVFQLVSHNVTL